MQSSQSGTPFLIPALTGIAMIEGLPEYLPPNAERSHRGYHLYNSNYNNQYTDNYTELSINDLKSKARQNGFTKIIKIGFDNNNFDIEKINV